jgi:hypothetical protein
MLILEVGEPVETPPALYIQATGDPVHPREDVDRFLISYRKTGGKIELQVYNSAFEAFPHSEPDSSGTARNSKHHRVRIRALLKGVRRHSRWGSLH